MRRNGKTSVRTLPGDEKNVPERLRNYYNNGVVMTNKTVKKPYSCGCNHGRSRCKLCINAQDKRPSRQEKKRNLLKQ
jgi:hypothetical protein